MVVSKIAIICDSTGSNSEKEQKEWGIHINYLSINFNMDSYQEFKELSPDKFIELCEQHEELPTTSHPAPGIIMELYESLLNQGYKHVIHITVSSKLSGSYQTALMSADLVDSSRIHVFDSCTVAYTQGMLAVNAAKKVTEGATIDKVLDYLEMMKQNNRFYCVINDLTNLRKGGRLSNIEAKLGSVLQIKPLLMLAHDGSVDPVEKVRTFKKALNRLVEITKEANLNNNYQLSVMHIVNLEGAKIVREKLQEIYPNLDIAIADISLVVAVHGGPRAVGVGWVKIK